MNIVDVLVILLFICIFLFWIFFKNKKKKSEVPAKCKGCPSFGMCSKKITKK